MQVGAQGGACGREFLLSLCHMTWLHSHNTRLHSHLTWSHFCSSSFAAFKPPTSFLVPQLDAVRGIKSVKEATLSLQEGGPAQDVRVAVVSGIHNVK